MRLEAASQSPDNYMQFHMGYSLSELLAPIGEEKVGQSVRHNGVYSSIKEARKADDPTLPMGVWTYDLKTADWSQVKSIALNAIAHKSKDLQLGIWLLEANIYLEGFSGVAPAMLLIEEMSKNYWDNMYPQMLDGDLEYRTNPLSWINEKITPVIKTLPLTDANLDGDELSWNDWESAQYYEKLKLQKQLDKKWDGVTPQDFKQRLAISKDEFLLALIGDLEDALSSIASLHNLLDQYCGDASPSFSNLTGVLDEIHTMMSIEVDRRGLKLMANETDSSSSSDGEGISDQNCGGNGDGGENNGILINRDDAFASLRKAADFLIKDDPHSLVPYLIYTACDWGKLSAPQLYQEVFLEKGGQINVFEIMGIKAE